MSQKIQFLKILLRRFLNYFLNKQFCRHIEATCDEVCREICETPAMPDLEEIVEVDFSPALVSVESQIIPPLVTHQVEPEALLIEKKNPFLLVKKPIIPEVTYRWQRGFRRDATGRYGKVTILKIQFKYEESQKLLPTSIIIENQRQSSLDEKEKLIEISNSVAAVEFLIDESEKGIYDLIY